MKPPVTCTLPQTHNTDRSNGKDSKGTKFTTSSSATRASCTQFPFFRENTSIIRATGSLSNKTARPREHRFHAIPRSYFAVAGEITSHILIRSWPEPCGFERVWQVSLPPLTISGQKVHYESEAGHGAGWA